MDRPRRRGAAPTPARDSSPPPPDQRPREKENPMKTLRTLRPLCVAVLLGISYIAHAQFQMERLSRGVIAVRTSSSQVYVGWRLFGTDASGTAFNLYRSTNGGVAMLLN